MSYTQVGPFTNGAAPGISASFLNGLETWILSVDQPSPTTVNGQTSGTATLYQYLTGTVKRCIVDLQNYKNTANQTIAIPTAFVRHAAVWVMETQGGAVAFLSGGSAVSIKVISSVGAGGGGQNPQTTIKYWSSGQIDAAFDTVQLQVNTGAANGVIIFEGF